MWEFLTAVATGIASSMVTKRVEPKLEQAATPPQDRNTGKSDNELLKEIRDALVVTDRDETVRCDVALTKVYVVNKQEYSQRVYKWGRNKTWLHVTFGPKGDGTFPTEGTFVIDYGTGKVERTFAANTEYELHYPDGFYIWVKADQTFEYANLNIRVVD